MILVCGECLVDLAPEDTSAGLWRAFPGGSPANTAVALARLEVPVSFAGRLSTDDFGTMLGRHLRDNRVDISPSVSAEEPSTLAMMSVDDDGHASYSFRLDGTADWGWRPGELPDWPPKRVAAVHAGSMALMMEPGCLEIEAFLRRCAGRAVISIDPNVRPVVCPDRTRYAAAVERWLTFTDVIKVSTDDLEWLYPGRAAADVARDWASMGPALVVLTLGADGARAWFGEQTVSVPGVPVAVADTVGAGDAFGAGLLRGLADGGHLTPPGVRALTRSDVSRVLEFACRVAALACTRPGANPPLLIDVER